MGTKLFEVFTRQAVKATFQLFTSASHRIHILQAPYNGPPTYETTFRQFSSNPRPTLLTSVNKRLDSMGNLDIMSEVWIRRDVLISDIDKVF